MTEAEWGVSGDPASMLDCLWTREHGYTTHWSNTFWNPATERRLRLFVVACCYRIWRLIPEGLHRDAVLAAERMADGLSSASELEELEHRLREEHDQAYERNSALYAVDQWEGRRRDRYDQVCPENTVWYTLARRSDLFQAAARGAAVLQAGADEAFDLGEPLEMGHRIGSLAGLTDEQIAARRDAWEGRRSVEQAAQASLVRDIFGNPFRPVTFYPAWRTDTAVSLAKGMYESRDFSDMPILADALQEAGCEEGFEHPVILPHCRGNGPHVRGCWVLDLVLGKG